MDCSLAQKQIFDTKDICSYTVGKSGGRIGYGWFFVAGVLRVLSHILVTCWQAKLLYERRESCNIPSKL
jgi:hypothetical protein